MSLPEDTAAELIQLYSSFGSLNNPQSLGTVGSGIVALPDPTIHAVTEVTISADTTFHLPHAEAGKVVTAQITQDGTGSWTGTFAVFSGDSGSIKWVGGANTLSTGAGDEDLAVLTCLDGTNWVGNLYLAVS